MATKKTTTKKTTTKAAEDQGVLKQLTKAEFSLLLSDALTWRDEKVNADHVAEIREAVKAGDTPPIVVARFTEDDETVDLMVDGVHRTTAAIENKQAEITGRLVEVADRNAAQVLAFSLNNHRVLNLTADERRKALIALLQLPCFQKESNRALAQLWKVSDMTIKRYRDMLKQESPKAAQSGHKNKAPKTTATGPKAPKTSSSSSSSTEKPEAAAPSPAASETDAGLPIELKCASRLCGGGGSLSRAIAKRIFTENDGSKVVRGSTAYGDGIKVIQDTIVQLQAMVDAHLEFEAREAAEDKKIDDAIAKAEAKAAAKAKSKK